MKFLKVICALVAVGINTFLPFPSSTIMLDWEKQCENGAQYIMDLEAKNKTMPVHERYEICLEKDIMSTGFDTGCSLGAMCQKIKDIKKKQNEFFEC